MFTNVASCSAASDSPPTSQPTLSALPLLFPKSREKGRYPS